MPSNDVVERLVSEVRASTLDVLQNYLTGATRDASFSPSHNTTRFHQKGTGWLSVVKEALTTLGHRAWMYEEGSRGVFVLETCWRPAHPTPCCVDERAAFCRGYFDADGGMPWSPSARLYFQYVQKDRDDLKSLRNHLTALGIACGQLHVPSIKVDPDYWRVFVRT